MNALRALVDDGNRQDLISNNLGEWILKGESHSALKGASMKTFSLQNMRARPDALGKYLMITPSPYILNGPHLLSTF